MGKRTSVGIVQCFSCDRWIARKVAFDGKSGGRGAVKWSLRYGLLKYGIDG